MFVRWKSYSSKIDDGIIITMLMQKKVKRCDPLRITLIGVGMVKNGKGFALVEVMVALVLIGFIAALFPALGTAIKAASQADVRTQALSLAYGQIEALKATLHSCRE
jgi:prepilin-type N-terminal cleavage/methylation domain-containing protein